MHITAYGKHRIIRTIPSEEKFLQVVNIYAVQIIYITNGGPGIRMNKGIQAFIYVFISHAIRAVFIALSLLVFHRSALVFKFLLSNRIKKKTHPVGFHP